VFISFLHSNELTINTIAQICFYENARRLELLSIQLITFKLQHCLNSRVADARTSCTRSLKCISWDGRIWPSLQFCLFIFQIVSFRRQRIGDLSGLRVKQPPVTASLTTQR